MGILSTYIVPHPPITVSEIGKGREKSVEDIITSYNDVAKQISDIQPDTIIVITPHSTIYADYFHISSGTSAYGNFTNFGAPNVSFNVNYDQELAETIGSVSVTSHIQAGCLGDAIEELDHGTMVPLYFINKFYTNYKLVRISISDYSTFTHYEFGKCINEACDKLNRKCILIASGDLSHYLSDDGPYEYHTEGAIYDSMITDTMKNASFMNILTFNNDFISNAGTCAHKPFAILAGAMDGKDIVSNFHAYNGSLGVGYAICSFSPVNASKINSKRQFDIHFKKSIKIELDSRKRNENPYVKLARLTVEQLVLNNRFLTFNDIAEFLEEEMVNKTAGVFVSIKKNGEVRGCVGTTISTTSCIAHEIVTNAINASHNDPRFVPVSVDELPYLTYSVDILNEPEVISSLNELDVLKYGILVTSDNKRGLLLPNLDSVKTPEQQLEIALKKAGINKEENYIIEKFEVTRYK